MRSFHLWALALLSGWILPNHASASVFVHVDVAASGATSGPANLNVTGDTAATARLSAFPSGVGTFFNQSYSSQVFGDPSCLFCGQSADARVTVDGSGAAKLFAGVGMTDTTQGTARANFELDDVLAVQGPLNLDLSVNFASLSRFTAAFYSRPYTTNANVHLHLDLEQIDNPLNSYQLRIEAVTSYVNNALLKTTELWLVEEQIDGGGWNTLATGTDLLGLLGHIGVQRNAVSLASGDWNLRYYGDTQAICGGGSSNTMTCPSQFDGWGTAHLNLGGNYTSQSGYTYSSAAAAVPEPGTLALMLPLLGLLPLIRRRK